MDANLISGTLTSIKTANDIVKSLLDLKEVSDIDRKVAELQSALFAAQGNTLEAQANHSALIEQVRALKEEIAEMVDWSTDKQKYKLVSFAEGAVAYVRQKEGAGMTPPHFICTNCYEDRRKTILNPAAKSDKGGRSFFSLVCPKCKSQIDTHFSTPIQPYYAEDMPTP